MQPLLQPLSLICILLLLSCAVLSDLRSRRIPNALVLSGIALSCTLHVLAYSIGAESPAGPAIHSPLLGLLAGGLSLFPLYLLRACGAGDVKLMAMVGSFIGASSVLNAALYTLLAGGLLSLVFMLGRGVAVQTLANVRFMLTHWMQRTSTGQGLRMEPLAMTAARLPYAVAISLGTLGALIWPL